jgi:hypothetical protein
MPSFVLLMILVGPTGTTLDHVPYDTLDHCKQTAGALQMVVANDGIDGFYTICIPADLHYNVPPSRQPGGLPKREEG